MTTTRNTQTKAVRGDLTNDILRYDVLVDGVKAGEVKRASGLGWKYRTSHIGTTSHTDAYGWHWKRAASKAEAVAVIVESR